MLDSTLFLVFTKFQTLNKKKQEEKELKVKLME
jgi:hypothetical protein